MNVVKRKITERLVITGPESEMDNAIAFAEDNGYSVDKQGTGSDEYMLHLSRDNCQCNNIELDAEINFWHAEVDSMHLMADNYYGEREKYKALGELARKVVKRLNVLKHGKMFGD